MPPARGGLSYLAIGTIFVVVLGGMWAGIQYSEGELLDREQPTDLEQQFRAAMWDLTTDDGGGGGQDVSVRVTAQETATELAAGEYFASETAVGLPGDTPDPLTKTKGLCSRTLVKLTVSDPIWNGSGAAVPEPVARNVTGQVVRLLDEHGARADFSRAVEDQRGIGVAVRGNTVFTVFRTCNLGY